MNIPKELRYSKEHEWVKVSGDNAVVGITEFAAEQLGDITLVDLPAAGKVVAAGEPMGVIESVKTVSELFAPISGTVKETNKELEDAPEKVNEDPYGQGWMLKIEMKDPGEAGRLLDADGYKAHLDGLE